MSRKGLYPTFKSCVNFKSPILNLNKVWKKCVNLSIKRLLFHFWERWFWSKAGIRIFKSDSRTPRYHPVHAIELTVSFVPSSDCLLITHILHTHSHTHQHCTHKHTYTLTYTYITQIVWKTVLINIWLHISTLSRSTYIKFTKILEN